MTTIAYNTKTSAVLCLFAASATNEDFDAAVGNKRNMFVESLDNLTIAELVSIYNALPDTKDVVKFANKATAVERVESALAEAGVPTYESGSKAPAQPKKPAANTDRSKAIADSWKDKKVAAARATRHSVTVNGEDYRSTAQAFEALNLPMGKHIPFRMALKAAGKKTFEHDGKKYNFTAHRAEA